MLDMPTITVDGDAFGTNRIKINGETLVEVHYVAPWIDNAKHESLTRRIVEMLEPDMNERADAAFAERRSLGVTDEEWSHAMGLACQMAANGSKLGASIIIIKAIREAVSKERETCAQLCADIGVKTRSSGAFDCEEAIRARGDANG